MTDALLRDLARVKALFQQRTIAAILTQRPPNPQRRTAKMTDINPTPEEAHTMAVRDQVEAMKGSVSDYHSVLVENRVIPGLMMKVRGDHVDLQFDGRWSIDVPLEYAPRVAWMLANAIAVGRGYAHLGSLDKNRPFAPEARGLPSSLLGSDDAS